MKYNFTHRNIHRDLAYFFLGLILAFSLSGIILNHRQQWYPMEYSYDTREVTVDLSGTEPTEEELQEIARNLETSYQSHNIRGNSLRVDMEDGGILEVDLNSGEGILEYRSLVPLIGHSILLHKSTNSFWIWYSDIFGLAMLTIAITGMFITSGNNSFRGRGWKLMAIGLIFPLVFLIFF